jgi:N-acetylmuramoyl-L-alanine amidase
MTRKLSHIAIVAIAACLLFPSISQGRSLRLVFDQRTVEVEEYRVEDERYVALPGLLEAFGAFTEWDEASKALKSHVGGHDWVFWAGSAIVSVDGDARTLGYPVVMRDDEPAAPLAAMVQLLGHYSGGEVSLQGPDVRVEKLGGTVLGYRIDTRRNGVVIELSMTNIVLYEAIVSEGNWINLSLNRAHLQPGRLNAWRPHPAVREVRTTQFASSAQLSFKMKNPVDKFLITTDEVQKKLTLLVGDTSFIMSASAVEPPRLEFDGVYNPVDMIVIDAGHGGIDFGATGMDEIIAEKDISLAIAERLAKRFKKDKEFSLVMTRENDRYLTSDERAAIANRAGADVFISIHANSSVKPGARGCQTFFAGQAHNDDAQRLAEFENSADTLALGDGIPSDSAKAEDDRRGYEFQNASADLAELIQQQFEAELKVPSRGVGQAEFTLLDKVKATGVMVFAAFVTHEDDEELLRRRSFQKDVAEAIYDAVLIYRAKRERAQAARLDQ